MQALSSSHLVAVGYDAEASALLLEFRDGSRYRYEGVTEDHYNGLLEAASPGTYLRTVIRPQYGDGSTS